MAAAGQQSDTIQGKLEQTLSRILEQPIAIHGSGRTDAGAHAAGQVASFHADTSRSCRELTALLRQYLPEDIGFWRLPRSRQGFMPA